MSRSKLFVIIFLCLFLENCGPVKFTTTGHIVAPDLNTSIFKPTAVAMADTKKFEKPKSLPQRKPASVDRVPCGLDTVTLPIKVLFLVDTSGSNRRAYHGYKDGSCRGRAGCVPATDPKKMFRSGSITQFFNTYGSKTNFSWGFETFSKHRAQSYITKNGEAAFGDAHDMQDAINLFNSEIDGGTTPYLEAFSAAKSAIANDPDLHSTDLYAPLYFVIFMSDGYPTDSTPQEIKTRVEEIVALAPTRVNLSSIYYGTLNDPFASAILQNISSIGGGQFVNVDTSAVRTIAIQDLMTLPTTSCQEQN